MSDAVAMVFSSLLLPSFIVNFSTNMVTYDSNIFEIYLKTANPTDYQPVGFTQYTIFFKKQTING